MRCASAVGTVASTQSLANHPQPHRDGGLGSSRPCRNGGVRLSDIDLVDLRYSKHLPFRGLVPPEMGRPIRSGGRIAPRRLKDPAFEHQTVWAVLHPGSYGMFPDHQGGHLAAPPPGNDSGLVDRRGIAAAAAVRLATLSVPAGTLGRPGSTSGPATAHTPRALAASHERSLPQFVLTQTSGLG